MVKTRKNKQKKTSLKTMAELADRHQLYELSVQCSEAEIDFVDATFQQLRDRKATLLREDFCGTANVCCEWVKRRKTNHAIGVDLDNEVLSWGRANNLTELNKKQQARIKLLNKNVLEVDTEQADIVSAMNFSYWLFKDRADLLKYFQSVHQGLKQDGILFMDAYGGYESFQEIEEEREIDADTGFTYTWHQASYNPLTNNLICHIHFDFPDGSRLEKAFTYDWRLWTLPEIKDVLTDAGFRNVTFYWQGWDEEGDGDGVFEAVSEADADAGWICYISAEK